MGLDADVSLVPAADLDLDEDIGDLDLDGSFNGKCNR